jgi:photosystem II stability/assembly factor-like uncharacterized protein
MRRLITLPTRSPVRAAVFLAVAAAAPAVAALAAVLLAVALPTAAASAAPFTSPDDLWAWSRPLPHGYPASAIAAPSAGTLFVATSVSDALVARRGGSSWAWSRTSAVPGFAGPDGVAFVSAQEGWAWGSDTTGLNGMVLHTTDGGATWKSSLVTTDRAALVARFAGSSGWVLANAVGDTQGYVLFMTSDGGQTWSAPRDVPQNDDTSLAALVAQGGDRAVVMQKFWSRGAGSGEVVRTKAWRTTNGGASWLAPATLQGANIVDAAFSSAANGWATGGHLLWHTTNGGASWRVARPAPPHAHLTTTGRDVWVISTGALHSSNGGATWTTLPKLSGHLIAFSAPAEGWIANGAAYLHTTDGGRSWRHLTTAPKSSVDGLSATADGTLWAAGGGIIRSLSGGRSWKRVSSRGVSAVTALSAAQAWAVGKKGLAIHTIDGGTHWTTQSTGVTVDLNDVLFADATHGFAGGDNGTLLRTVDGGRRWHAQHSTIGSGIRTLAFADRLHGIAIAFSLRPGILYTADGGVTWSTSQLSVNTDRPTAVTMLDATHAVLIAYDVTNRATHTWTSGDGGATWQQGNEVPRRDYYVAIARAGSKLSAVGIFGGVATSSDSGVTWSSGLPMGGAMTGVAFVGAATLAISGDYGIMTRDLLTAPLP